MKNVSKVMHQFRRVEVKADGQCTGECGGGDSDGFECHRTERNQPRLNDS